MAIGCSTNAIVHVIALGRRAGFDIGLDDFDRIGREVPVIANIRQIDTYLMEDFYAGGLRAMLKRISAHLYAQSRPSMASVEIILLMLRSTMMILFEQWIILYTKLVLWSC